MDNDNIYVGTGLQLMFISHPSASCYSLFCMNSTDLTLCNGLSILRAIKVCGCEEIAGLHHTDFQARQVHLIVGLSEKGSSHNLVRNSSVPQTAFTQGLVYGHKHSALSYNSSPVYMLLRIKKKMFPSLQSIGKSS